MEAESITPARGLPLSVLIDQLAGEGPRDEAFVRAFTRWLADHADVLALPLVERLGLRDVVLTFKMQRTVRLLITGTPPDDLPGDVTITVGERDFPAVDVSLLETPRADPYELCTLDYSLAGRRVRITAGPQESAMGRLVVAATVGAREEHRVQLDDGEIATFSGLVLEFLD